MIIHPFWLTIIPVFLLETLALPYVPVFGVVAPITIIVLVLHMRAISIARIWLVVVVFGYVSDVFAGINVGAHFLAWIVAGGMLTSLIYTNKQETISFFWIVVYCLLTVISYQLVLYVFSTEVGIFHWSHYVASVALVSTGAAFAILASEKVINKIRP